MDDIVKAYMAWSFHTDRKEADNKDAGEIETYHLCMVTSSHIPKSPCCMFSSLYD